MCRGLQTFTTRPRVAIYLAGLAGHLTVTPDLRNGTALSYPITEIVRDSSHHPESLPAALFALPKELEASNAYALAASPSVNLFFSTPWLMTTARFLPTALITVAKRVAGELMRNNSLE